MISAENSTLERIQKEIKDVMEREKELKKYQSTVNINNNNNNNDDDPPVPVTNGEVSVKPPFLRTQSTSALLNGGTNGTNIRRFTTNPNVKGVMQRFIKSRGKINVVNTISNPKPAPVWTPPDYTAQKNPGETKYIRNGFIPVEERLRKEIQEEHDREMELRTQRRRSQPTFETYSLELEDVQVEKPAGFALRATKSMAQLYDSCDNLAEESVSPPSSLKQAKSLAELCDVSEDEVQTPQSLIQRFEKMIIKNKSAARA